MTFPVQQERLGPDATKLSATDSEDGAKIRMSDEFTRRQAWCLYLSHFLSMWTSRTYEYAALLFIQQTFPGDLLPSSINGMADMLSILLSSAAIGRWIDQCPTRLKPLLLSILTNRLTVVFCCIFWVAVFFTKDHTTHRVLFAILVLLGMVEKASRISNMLSLERDWIPTIAGPSTYQGVSHRPLYDLTYLNTVIRRIDIICKLLAPLAILGIMTLVQPWLVALLVCIIGVISCMIEVGGAIFVWKSSRRLRKAKLGSNLAKPAKIAPTSTRGKVMRFLRGATSIIRAQIDGFQYYFSTRIWLPSLGVAILHSSVLEWSGTLITWLLNYNFSYTDITIGKGVGSIFEIGSTFVFPLAIAFFSKKAVSKYQIVSTDEEIGQKRLDDDDDYEQLEVDNNSQINKRFGDLCAMVTTAKWSIISLIVCLVPMLAALFVMDHAMDMSTVGWTAPSLPHRVLHGMTGTTEASTLFEVSPVSIVIFMTFLSLSCLGRWTYDLSIMQLTQVVIPAYRRAEFGGSEFALIALLSFTHWTSAAVWHHQSDFKWLAVGSVCAVAITTTGYLFWAANWRRKGRIIAMDRDK